MLVVTTSLLSLIFTVTPGTVSPLLSTTVPDIRLAVCANKVVKGTVISNRKNSKLVHLPFLLWGFSLIITVKFGSFNLVCCGGCSVIYFGWF